MAARRTPNKPRLPGRVDVRLPAAWPRAVELAAERRYVSLAEWVRSAIARQLIAEGVEVPSTSIAA